jgi:hypothetical protein
MQALLLPPPAARNGTLMPHHQRAISFIRVYEWDFGEQT